MNIFWEIHSKLPQEGPGDDRSTLQALSLIPGLPAEPHILDIGCGPGRQTLALAKKTGGQVIALDTHEPFLEEVSRRADAAGLARRIATKKCSMSEMDFADGEFDLLWAEGSIYIMGFQKGLKSWRRFLKPGGSLAVTELTWLTDNPPEKARRFWDKEYPSMTTIAGNSNMIHEAGYFLIDSFTLRESAWWDGYYIPLEKRLARLHDKYQDNPEALSFLAGEQQEIDLYREYSAAYGYVFYVMQKPAGK